MKVLTRRDANKTRLKQKKRNDELKYESINQ